jgi:hypothetical protein
VVIGVARFVVDSSGGTAPRMLPLGRSSLCGLSLSVDSVESFMYGVRSVIHMSAAASATGPRVPLYFHPAIS